MEAKVVTEGATVPLDFSLDAPCGIQARFVAVVAPESLDSLQARVAQLFAPVRSAVPAGAAVCLALAAAAWRSCGDKKKRARQDIEMQEDLQQERLESEAEKRALVEHSRQQEADMNGDEEEDDEDYWRSMPLPPCPPRGMARATSWFGPARATASSGGPRPAS